MKPDIQEIKERAEKAKIVISDGNTKNQLAGGCLSRCKICVELCDNNTALLADNEIMAETIAQLQADNERLQGELGAAKKDMENAFDDMYNKCHFCKHANGLKCRLRMDGKECAFEWRGKGE